MFVVMSLDASEEALNAVRSLILDEGLTPHENRGASGIVIAVLGEGGARLDRLGDRLAAQPGVASVTRTDRPFKLTSRSFHPTDTVVEVGRVRIGDGSLTIMAGPCSVESREQLFETADAVAAAGADILRGGAFKPRTSPYSFQGLGLDGLRLLAEARERTGLPVITEVMEPGQVELVAEYADILQIGARNMQNYSLLMAVGKAGRPVLLKRGLSGTIEEWLMAAEYVMSSGNPNVILCERGIRTFETATRNTLDIAAVPLLHELTHLPVVIDPSHATGKRWLVAPLVAGRSGDRGGRPDDRGPPAARRRRFPTGPSRVTLEQFARALPRPSAPCTTRRHPSTLPAAARVAAAGSKRLSAGRARHAPGRPHRPWRQARRLRGETHLPGDKSISHRALLLALLAAGESRITGASDGRDVRATADVATALGAHLARSGDDPRAVDYIVVSPGRAALCEPAGILDCRNSGTTLRLVAGILAGLPGFAVLDGDASLRRRPMARVAAPLVAMGASRRRTRPGPPCAPFAITGSSALRGIDHATSVPSAQVKSCVLLAGLAATGSTSVRESIFDAGPHGADAPRARGAGPDGAPRRWRAVHTVGGPATVRAARRAGPRRHLGRGVLAGRRRRPPRRGAPPPERRDEPDAAWDHRPAAADGRRDRGAAARHSAAATASGRAERRSRRPEQRRCAGSTSTRPMWPARSTRFPSSAWPRRSRPVAAGSAASGSCATRSPTASPASRPGSRPLGARVRADGDDIEIEGGRAPAGRPGRQS